MNVGEDGWKSRDCVRRRDEEKWRQIQGNGKETENSRIEVTNIYSFLDKKRTEFVKKGIITKARLESRLWERPGTALGTLCI